MKLTPLWSLSAVGALTLGVACSDSKSDESTDTSVTTSTTTAMTVVEHPGGSEYLTGTIDQFQIDAGTSTVDASGVQHTRDGTVSYRVVSDDPRVAGTATGTWNTDRWGTMTDGVMVQWGEATITNDGGTWVADYQGAFSSETGDVITRWWRGTGDYAGLTFFMWIGGSTVGVGFFEWSGIIVPGDPPPGVAT